MKAILIEGATYAGERWRRRNRGWARCAFGFGPPLLTADLVQRAGAHAPPPGAGSILGLECAGEIDAVGPEVANFAVGDAVCALLAGEATRRGWWFPRGAGPAPPFGHD